MGKCMVQNMGMIITNKCNLDCAHCMRGEKDNIDMLDLVIDKTFDNIKGVHNLNICGGEPTLAIPQIEKIINRVVDGKIYVNAFSLIINGTIYSEELIRLLDYIYDYIHFFAKKNRCYLGISYDKFHMDEIVNLGLKEEYIENVNRYSESKHFYKLEGITKKLFREGNAEYLPTDLTVPLKELPYIITYAGNRGKFDRENGLCNVGPIVAINPDGIVTDCNGSIKNQETIYNYGNILEEDLEDIILRHGEVVEPREFNKRLKKVLKDYQNYE